MEGFGSDFAAGAAGGKVDTGTIMEQVKVQIAVANAQELLQVQSHTIFCVKSITLRCVLFRHSCVTVECVLLSLYLVLIRNTTTHVCCIINQW